MFYQSLDNIKTEFLIDDKTIGIVLAIFQKLRRSDTLTTGVFSRKTGLEFSVAESFLMRCVEMGILDIIILVPCKDEPEDHPPVIFNSLKDYTKAYINKKSEYNCSYCSGPYDFDQALTAFKKPSRNRKMGIQK
ncbi:hypothetical protein COD13_29030 [Priestia megaterium]|uniref:hypothetical protein n=1 Tax=Priestia megaterium TaxID=1404 RepID=UPI000BFDDB24|nr:hypothetical protein [Priestia megaterium]PGT49815.1 hypothetical protein COD13_29030 [Priestia megaterium]